MKLRTAIVEDQKPDAERLEQLLKKAFGEEEILCRRFVCGDDFLKEFPGEGYQVVFLDICMEGTNGIETARQLRDADPELLIVFVTSSPEYVWDAFPVHPFDYLLKPYKEEKFDHLAGELRRVLGRQQPELEVRIARQTVHLPLKKIHYAMAQNHFVKVVTDDGECRAAANFAQVQEQLMTQPDFLVCNRGVIINMSKVLRFDGECIEMLDGARLPVRQKDKKKPAGTVYAVSVPQYAAADVRPERRNVCEFCIVWTFFSGICNDVSGRIPLPCLAAGAPACAA